MLWYKTHADFRLHVRATTHQFLHNNVYCSYTNGNFHISTRCVFHSFKTNVFYVGTTLAEVIQQMFFNSPQGKKVMPRVRIELTTLRFLTNSDYETDALPGYFATEATGKSV